MSFRTNAKQTEYQSMANPRFVSQSFKKGLELLIKQFQSLQNLSIILVALIFENQNTCFFWLKTILITAYGHLNAEHVTTMRINETRYPTGHICILSSTFSRSKYV